MGKVAEGKINVKRLAVGHLLSAAKAIHNGHPDQAVEHARKGYQFAVAWQAKEEKNE